MKNKILRLFKAQDITTTYQLFQVLRTVVLILVSIVLVKSSYTKNQTSEFESFLLIVNISTFFWIIGMSNAMLSYYPKLATKAKQGFFKNTFVLFQSIGAIAAILIYLTKGFTLNEGYESPSDHFVRLTSLYVFFLSPTIIIEIKYVLQNKVKSLLTYGATIYSLQLLLSILAILLFDTILPIIITFTFWIIIRWIWTIQVVFFDKDYGVLSLRNNWGFIAFSLPIIAHILLGNGMEFIDSILVKKNFEPDMFSLYRYGAREFPLFLVLIGAIRSAMIPKAVLNIDEAAQNIREKTDKLMIWAFPLSIVLVLSSKYLFTLFYSADYQYSSLLFNIYILIITSRILLPEVFIYAKHQNNILMTVSFFELILNIIVSLILIQFFGIAGIVFATFIVFSISKIYLVLHVKLKYGINLNSYINLKKYALLSVALLLAFVLNYFF